MMCSACCVEMSHVSTIYHLTFFPISESLWAIDCMFVAARCCLYATASLFHDVLPLGEWLQDREQLTMIDEARGLHI